MTCCCAKPARFLLWDPTSTHDLATEDHMQRLNARRTENSEGWAVRAHIGASPLLQKQSKFSSALTEVRLICGSAGHVLEPVWENFLRNLIGTPATLNNQALLLPQCTVAGWSNLTCAPLGEVTQKLTTPLILISRHSHNHDTPVVPIRRGNQARPSAFGLPSLFNGD
jgi:hypothetical protein